MTKATKENSEKLAQMSMDCSFMLSHLIRLNPQSIKTDGDAKDALSSILGLKDEHSKPILKGSEVGWYPADAKVHSPSSPHDPENPGYFFKPESKSGVCFTESTFAGLRAHRDVFSVKYGLSFTRNFLYKKGANPCLNIRESILKLKVNDKSERYDRLYNFIPAELAGYVNIINESFNSVHEREWRYLGDLEFEWSDVLFVFCPCEEFPFFSKVQHQGLPILFDLKWIDKI